MQSGIILHFLHEKEQELQMEILGLNNLIQSQNSDY